MEDGTFTLYKSNNKVGDFSNKIYRNKEVISTLEDLVEVAQYDCVKGEIELHDRSQGNEFIQGDVVVLDVDNTFSDQKEDWITIEYWKKVSEGLQQYIIPSKNHWTEKIEEKRLPDTDENGKPLYNNKGNMIRSLQEVRYTPRPKFHVYLPLRKMYAGEDIKAFHKKLESKYSFLDDAMRTPKQFIAGNQSNKYRKTDIHEMQGSFLDDVIEISKKKEVSVWNNKEKYINIEEGNRNRALLSKLGHLKAKGWTADMLREGAHEFNRTFSPPLSEEEVNTIVKYIIGTFNGCDCDDVLRDLQERYSLIEIGGSTFVMENNDITNLKTLAAFKNLYAHLQWIPPGKRIEEDLTRRWLKDPNTVKYVDFIFDANLPQVIDASKKTGGKILNQWKGFAVEPNPEEDCSDYLQLMYEIICNKDEKKYEYLLNWMAQIVQYPTDKNPNSTAIILTGEKGSGKGTFGTGFGRLFKSDNYLKTNKRTDLFGRFNTNLAGKVFVFGDEIEFPGDTQLVDEFKALITDTGDRELRIEKKFADQSYEKNAMRFILTTNHRWAAPISGKERRYVIFEVSSAWVGNTSLFDKIDKQMKNGGNAKLLDILLKRDISEVDWYASIPKDDHYITQKNYNLDIVEKFIQGNIEQIRNKEAIEKDELIKRDDSDFTWTFITYSGRFDRYYITITPEELYQKFFIYLKRYGSTKDKNYPMSRQSFDYEFRKILFSGKKFIKVQKMINSVKYYHFHEMSLVREWNKHLTQ